MPDTGPLLLQPCHLINRRVDLANKCDSLRDKRATEYIIPLSLILSVPGYLVFFW